MLKRVSGVQVVFRDNGAIGRGQGYWNLFFSLTRILGLKNKNLSQSFVLYLGINSHFTVHSIKVLYSCYVLEYFTTTVCINKAYTREEDSTNCQDTNGYHFYVGILS